MKRHLLSDQELIELLLAKEKKGFDLLYDRYGKALYNIIAKIVHDNEFAQDVLQDTFIKIWQHIKYYDASKGRLFTWMLNIARHTAIDKIRTSAYKNEFSAIRLHEEYKSVDKSFFSEIQVDTIGLSKYVAMLKPDEQQIIDYLYMKGYTHLQAAEQLHIPLGTVKTRTKRAIRSLQALLL